MYLEYFRREILKTLKSIKDEKKNSPDRVFFDIINEKIVHLLTYFSKYYDNNDIESMYTVFDYYITALKHVFFPLKKISNMYKFYGVFKKLMDHNIYQSSEIRFLLHDICELEIQIIPEKPMLDVEVIVTLYYRKIISKKDFGSSIHDFVLEELRKGNNQILSSIGRPPPPPTSPLLTSSRSSSRSSSSLPLPLQLPSPPPPNSPSPISHVGSPNSYIGSPLLSIGTPESDHSVSSASTGETRRRGRLTPTRRRIVVTPSAPSRRREHENIVFGRSLGSVSSGSASLSGSASSGSASSGSASSGSASSGSASSGSASSRRRANTRRADTRRTTRRRRGQPRESARSNY